MDFLFSRRINRLTYLWRHLLSLAIMGLGLALIGPESLVTGDILKSIAHASLPFYLGIGLGGLLALLGLVYYVRFAMLARMESIGMVLWDAFCLVLLSGVLLLGVGLCYKWASQNGISIWLWLFVPLVLTVLIFDLVLLTLQEDAYRQGNVMQIILYYLEVGSGRSIIRAIPLFFGFSFLLIFYDFSFYRGLNDAQSMDNAQVARQIARQEGFTTEFLRPYALAQMHAYLTRSRVTNQGSEDIFPSNRFPAGTPRVLPDTYNAPGYPYLLAAWFLAVQPQFDQTMDEISKKHQYSGDRWIPEFNQIFVFLTLLLIFVLSRRLFDERVAWISVMAFILTDTVWQYSLTALSTCMLMFLITALLACALEIFVVSEKMSEKMAQDEEGSLALAWPWLLLLGLLLAAACLTRLHLLILLAPLLLFFIALPRSHPVLFAFVTLLVIGPVGLWFWHIYRICGNPVGSNLPLLLYGGEEHYMGNEIYCSMAIPSYEQLFENAGNKEYAGFIWHFQRGWYLLGSNPMVLLAITSFLHRFKRQRVRAFQWLVAGCALSLIAANNLCSPQPEALDSWNVVILLLPVLVMLGSAFFFILLDRMNLHIPLLRTLIVISILAVTALPMPGILTTLRRYPYNFPPYFPNIINTIGDLSAPDEWVTTDMPWATAWYADRASLWLPDSITDFENIHDNFCPTGILLLTPVTQNKTVADLSSGEFKEWYPLLFLNTMPPHFPLGEHAVFRPVGPGSDYSMWSDRPRWKAQR